MTRRIMTLFLGFALSFITFNLSFACTDFRINAKDGTMLVGRSLEFGLDLKSNLRSSNQGRAFTSTTPNGKAGLNWKAKYGYVYLDALDQDIVVDGMNENGLSFEYLYLPGETQFQTVPSGKDNQAIPYYQFGDWVLSNFKTVDDVKEALASLYVFEQTIPSIGNVVFPVHAAIQDASGKGIVVEFVNGKMTIDEYIGVMTNSPTYEWQVTNLRNYLNLSPYNPKPITANGVTFSMTGQGAGSFGLPGDPSPPSRFVKIAFMLKNAYQPANTSDAVNLAEHLLNNVDLPGGIARSMDNGKESSDITEWAE